VCPVKAAVEEGKQTVTVELHVQGAAEIVKNFKILVTCFSARVSRSAGI